MNDKNIDFDFGGHVKNIEDVESFDTGEVNPITYNELLDSGLVKTSAFVRSKKSKNALRVAKHKELKADKGIKQVNVEVPIECIDLVKEYAKKLIDNGSASVPAIVAPVKRSAFSVWFLSFFFGIKVA